MKHIFKNKIVLLLAALGVFTTSFAQQAPEYTQYMYNTMSINPAYTSSIDNLEANLLYRSQWVGLDGAPKTGNFSILTPFSNQRMGIGLNLVNDKIGPASETLATINYAYNVPLSLFHTLSVGVNAGTKFVDIDWSKGNRLDLKDPVFGSNISEVKPVIGAGMYFYTDKYYIGLSVPNFIKSKYYDDVQKAQAADALHYYLVAGYVFDLSESVKFKPSIMTKAVSGSPLSYDLSANFMFHQKLTIGAAYRWDDSVSGLVGFQISNALFIGYAYDYSTSNVSNYNQGSHEVILKFRLLNNSSAIKSPRFF